VSPFAFELQLPQLLGIHPIINVTCLCPYMKPVPGQQPKLPPPVMSLACHHPHFSFIPIVLFTYFLLLYLLSPPKIPIYFLSCIQFATSFYFVSHLRLLISFFVICNARVVNSSLACYYVFLSVFLIRASYFVTQLLSQLS